MSLVSSADPEVRPYLPSEERRVQIVEAAIGLMAARRLTAVSLRDVAAATGVPLSSVSYHFGSREALLGAVMEAMTDKFCAAMVAAAPAGESLPEILDGLVEAVATGAGYSPGHHMLLLEFTLYAARLPESDLARWQYERYEAAALRVLDQIDEQTGSTYAGDRQVLVRLVLALLEGVTLQQLAAGDPGVIRPLLGQLLDLLNPQLEERDE